MYNFFSLFIIFWGFGYFFYIELQEFLRQLEIDKIWIFSRAKTTVFLKREFYLPFDFFSILQFFKIMENSFTWVKVEYDE